MDVNQFSVKYDKFYSSFKAIGEIDDECMNAYAQVFNSENSEAVPDQRKCTKYCFTSYFTVTNNLVPNYYLYIYHVIIIFSFIVTYITCF